MILGIELDDILCDLQGGLDAAVETYYRGAAALHERQALPDTVPDFYLGLRPVNGIIGDLLRVREHDPRLELIVVSSRPERFMTDTKNWLRKWLPERQLPWTLNVTPDFGLIRSPQMWVVSDARRPELLGRPTVLGSVLELGYGTQERLPI